MRHARRNNSGVESNSILERLRERILRFAASRVSKEAAEDIAQEVLLVLHEKYRQVERAEELVPLSIEIARFKILGARRKSARRGEYAQLSVEDLPLASRDADPFQQAAKREQLEHLEAAMRGLGDRCKDLFRLKLEGLSFPEIQKQLKVDSLNTLYTWDFRCRKQVQDFMKEKRT